MKILENRSTSFKYVGNMTYVEFYEDNKMIGLIDYSRKSKYYIDDAIENFMTGILTKETIKRYNLGAIPDEKENKNQEPHSTSNQDY